MENLLMKSILIQKHNSFHYGYILVSIKEQLLRMNETWQSSEKYIGYEDDLLDIQTLLSDISDLILLLQKEEETSHIRSKKYLNKQKKFFEKLNSYLPRLYR